MKRLFIDPTYTVYENNKLFDANDIFLNRDDTLAPFIQLKKDLAERSIELLTFDCIKNFSAEEVKGDGYISLGIIRDLKSLKEQGLRLLAFYILEPPLVIDRTYKSLPYLSQFFEKVFLHNIKGDGYDLKDVRHQVLDKVYYPQPYGSVREKFWNITDRMNKIVIINGHHRPRPFFKKELYSARIIWAVGLNKHMPVDLFGRGWDRFFSRSSLWLTYLVNFRSLMKIYQGACGSKLEVMSKYDFALCFENFIMDGYITEKIFDCFYSGVIPIYRGGDDVSEWIPKNCYIDLRDFKGPKDLSTYLLNMTSEEKKSFREAGRSFIASTEGQKYSRMIDGLVFSL